jgi:hypothetical protein
MHGGSFSYIDFPQSLKATLTITYLSTDYFAHTMVYATGLLVQAAWVMFGWRKILNVIADMTYELIWISVQTGVKTHDQNPKRRTRMRIYIVYFTIFPAWFNFTLNILMVLGLDAIAFMATVWMFVLPFMKGNKI